LIEQGWPASDLRKWSCGKLVLVQRASVRRRLRIEQRSFRLAMAAHAGGDAAQEVWNALERELRMIGCGNVPPAEMKSTMPLSREEFERTMKEPNA
jgi:hypothetical protein